MVAFASDCAAIDLIGWRYNPATRPIARHPFACPMLVYSAMRATPFRLEQISFSGSLRSMRWSRTHPRRVVPRTLRGHELVNGRQCRRVLCLHHHLTSPRELVIAV